MDELGLGRADGAAAWYAAHFDELVRLATLATGDGARAEDAVQEVFAEILRRPPTIDGRPISYLRVAVLNRCRSRVRRERRGEALHLRLAARDDADVDLAAVGADTSGRVAAAVRALPRRQRDVVLLRYWLDLSEAEIADTLAISPGTVKSSASRARTALAPLLEELR